MSVPVAISAVLRNKARAAGAADWPARLPDLIAGLERDWSITVGAPYPGGTEAYVARATGADGAPVVLKLLVPRPLAAGQEITVLRLAAGRGCPRLLRADEDRGALLLERLGRPLADLGLPLRATRASGPAGWPGGAGSTLPRSGSGA